MLKLHAKGERIVIALLSLYILFLIVVLVIANVLPVSVPVLSFILLSFLREGQDLHPVVEKRIWLRHVDDIELYLS